MSDLLRQLSEVVRHYDEDTESAHYVEDVFLVQLVSAAAFGVDITEAAVAYVAWWDGGGKDRIRWYS